MYGTFQRYMENKRVFDLLFARLIIKVIYPIKYYQSSLFKESNFMQKSWDLSHRVLLGTHSFIAPRFEEQFRCKSKILKLLQTQEGIFSPAHLKNLANIHYQNDQVYWKKYLKNPSILKDLILIFKSLPYLSFPNHHKIQEKMTLFGFQITNLSQDQSIQYVISRILQNKGLSLAFLNSHTINLSIKDMSYKNCLQTFDLLLCDGIGMRIAAKAHNQRIVENLNGTDLIPKLLKSLPKDTRVFLLGSSQKNITQVHIKMSQQFQELNFVGYNHGYLNSKQNDSLLVELQSTQTQVILVAMGNPNQEQWIHKHIKANDNIIAIGVGGFFDFYSGQKQRAPLWIREISFEWAYRLYLEPRRLFRRYILGNILFLYHLMKQKKEWKQ